ncbi:hypothetical protein EDB83DRAFT_2318742 [Lactarius deliciosus]|nr:hypothetical protein EDB83DRAFT_2318742 [Lactarius deliciosus]
MVKNRTQPDFQTLLEEHFKAWCLLELSTFLEWWKDVRTGDTFQSSPHAPTRSAIFEDEHLYTDDMRWSVAAYILIPKSTFVLNLTKEVVLAPCKLCSAQPMSLQPLFYSLHHWYYLLLMDDVMVDLETAACGYLECLDTFRPTNGFKCSLDKMENKKNDKAGHMAKKARMSAASQIPQLETVELRCLTDVGMAPEWFPKTQDVWIHAMNHISHLELASSVSPCWFSLPPIHLFWGGNDENQRIYYYHFLILRHEIWERPMCDLPPLTTSKWSMGPSFFGDQRSMDVASGCYNITTSLPCHCDIQMTMVDDTDICQVVLYYLNLYHVFEEVKEMERIQFPATFEKRWRGQEMYVYMIVEMWDSSGGNTNFKFFENKKVWRNWLWAVCEVVMGWDGFDGWDWGGFSNVLATGSPLPPLLLMAPTVVRVGSFTTFTKPALCLVVSRWELVHVTTLRWSGGIDGSMFNVPTTTLFISSWVSKSLGWRLLEYRSVPSLPPLSWHDHQTPPTYHRLGWGCIGELHQEALASVHMDVVGLMVSWPELLPLRGVTAGRCRACGKQKAGLGESDSCAALLCQFRFESQDLGIPKH